ncbi:MAG: aminopeptidase [candidate division Zixibacteria bacterium]|nr:aminopeptidase [candidate division Zixibacteria bacterium]
MRDQRVVTLAENLVNYSLDLKPGERVWIETRGFPVLEMAKEMITQATKKGAVPFWYYNDDSLTRRWLLECSEIQITKFTEFHLTMMKMTDAFVSFRGGDNVFDLGDIPEKKMKQYMTLYYKPVHLEQRVKHTKWVVLRYPTNSFAQLAEASQEAFEDFYFDVCNLDYAKMSKAMDPLCKLLSQTDKVRIVGPGTDLSFSIKGIPNKKCDGKLNIPDGEVFTAPVRDSVNGNIAFNTPSLREGVLYDGITLQFKGGKIVDAKATVNQERMNKLLDTDEGARYVGEFSFGINPAIKRCLKDTLFDEKIFGSIHLTPGAAYDEADNGNKSAIHWDLVLIQTKEHGGGEIYFDDVLIRKDGIFVHPKLKDSLSEQALTS